MSMFREPLVLRALAALSEIADGCGAAPAPKSLSLRFILAYTFVAAGADPKLKWIWNSFWEHATTRTAQPMDDYIRGTGARSALNGICREIGYPTDADFLTMLREHRKAREVGRPERKLPAHANDDPSDDDAA